MKKILFIFIFCLVFAPLAFSADRLPIDTKSLATKGVADSLGLGTTRGKFASSSPKYEDVISGLGPEKKPDEFCDTPDCLNLIAICEIIPDGAPNAIIITKYEVGDCIGRGSRMALGSYTDFMANIEKIDVKQVGGNNLTIYKIVQSNDVNGNWENLYYNTIDYAAVRITNYSSDKDGILEKNNK